MTKVKWGILSTAKIAQRALIPAFDRAENAEVVGIASGSGKASDVAASFNIPKSYTTYEEMLQDPEIDAIYIPLPNHLSLEYSVFLIQKNIGTNRTICIFVYKIITPVKTRYV